MASSVTELLRKHALETIGVFDKRPVPDLDELLATEWSPRFEKLMRENLLMGAFRYGLLKANKGRASNRIRDAIRRLNVYLKTGNADMLVDVANFCLVEFECEDVVARSVDDGEHYEFKEVGKRHEN
jgi:hypothetical protein